MTIRRIRLLPQQIPFFWEAIKRASSETCQVKEKDLPIYFNNLLHALLNDKAQCFIQMDENKVLLALTITKIVFNKITGEKELDSPTSYAWHRMGSDEWLSTYAFLMGFAKHAGCKRMVFKSNNPTVWAVCEKFKIPEVSRNFAVEVQ